MEGSRCVSSIHREVNLTLTLPVTSVCVIMNNKQYFFYVLICLACTWSTGHFLTFFQQKFDWEIDNISVHVYTALGDWNYMLKAEDLNTMPTYFFFKL